jgi:tetrachlorobenzoquinone reductase
MIRDETRQPERIAVRVHAIVYAGPDVNLYDLRPIEGSLLPAFESGAHVDLHLPNGIVRQYSLANDQREYHRYLFGIKRDLHSRGGSRYIHDNLRVSDTLFVGAPRNTFALNGEQVPVVFISGGIGVTPFLSMARRAADLGLEWILHAAMRRRSETAVLSELAEVQKRVVIHIDEECGDKPIDLAPIIASASPDTHFYCCGPGPMLKAFEEATRKRPASKIHVEHFQNEAAAVETRGFSVRLARSNRTIDVQPGQTIAAALRNAGIDISTSCEQGVCGACETRVLEGVPDHLDLILTDDEKVANKSMMICCSGCLGDLLLLDL